MMNEIDAHLAKNGWHKSNHYIADYCREYKSMKTKPHFTSKEFAALPLSERIELRRAERLETAPISARGILARSYTGKSSPRGCIKAFCLECVGFDRAAVTTCTAYACPLWNIRPYQGKVSQ